MTIGRNAESGEITHRSREVWRRLPLIFLPMLAFLVAGPMIVFSRDRVRDRHLASQRGRDVVELQSRIIERELEAVTAMLLHFSDQKILRDFLDDRSTRAEIEEEYLRFCRVSGVFDQLRLIGEDGVETLRINYEAGEPTAVREARLQSKADRYYFRLAKHLEKNQVYISPFDLNLEHGQIEEPWKPVLRLATPVFDRSGRRRGIFVLNYLGSSLLERLDSVASQAPGWTGLVNRDGYYLAGPDLERSWGFMFGREPTFAGDHPDAWKSIRGGHEDSFITEEGMFTFGTVIPVGRLEWSVEDFPTGMKVVSFVPTAVLYASSWHTFERLGLGTLLIAAVMFAIAWRLAFVGAVRQNHEHKIAASERRLRVLSQRLLDAGENERKSLARDLHDEVGQLATAITIDLKRAKRVEGVDAKNALIDRSLEGTARLLDSMHRISSRIRSSILDDLGLKAVLRSCGEDFERTSGVPVEVELDFEEERMPERVAENVYRIVQEALTNVSRHARAKHVAVHVSQRNGQLDVSVRDQGVGFDPAQADPGRLGLLGMRERVELLGGRFEIESAPARGTLIRASIPLDSTEVKA